jgi:probable rRNA maturation factor
MDFAPPDEVGTPQGKMLGDIAICVSVILEEAARQDKPILAHWAHMTVHGMLHLQGYDHVQEQDATRMEQLEVDIMARLGYKSPYEDVL